MCLNPITIRNPTKNIAKVGGTQLYLEVPCNKCAECKNKVRAEWSFRSYHEVLSTLKKGGYIYFDTLTYSDEHLPHLSDFVDLTKMPQVHNFSCFNHQHFKLFLKRLRRNLHYNYGVNTFKYFLTSEYGVDDRYTHRPHYHILFYITIPVHPYEFSRLVSDAWYYGRTDGVVYKGNRYVADHVYGYDLGYGMNTQHSAVVSICNYVSKYVTKSSKFQDKLDKRMFMLSTYINDDETLKELRRSMDMFHRQSQGFGLSYIYAMSEREINNLFDNCVIIPDSKNVISTYPLPTYYKRKVFYQNKKRDDGTRYWELTPIGQHFQVLGKIRQVDKNVTNYNDIINTFTQDDKDLLSYYLDGRSIQDYAIYNVFYKYRDRIYSSYELGDLEYNLLDWLDVCNMASQSNSLSKTLVYSVDDERNIHLSLDYSCAYSAYIKNNAMTPANVKEFRHYDKIDELLNKYRKPISEQKQNTFNHQEQYKERMKLLNLM